MTERDQLARPLGRHDARNLGHREHVALGHRVRRDLLVRLARHPHLPFGDSGALGLRLAADIHHPGPAGIVEMAQLHSTSASSSPSTARRTCGFTLP